MEELEELEELEEEEDMLLDEVGVSKCGLIALEHERGVDTTRV